MMADWEGLAFELGTWKNTGTFILKGTNSQDPMVWSAWVHSPCNAARAAGP